MNFSAWALEKPIPSILLFTILFIAGIVGFNKLPVQNLPDMDFPIVNVTASLPGASPATLENEVTRIIEDSIASVGRVKHITSTINEGVSVTLVQFELEKDPQEAVSDVSNAVSKVRAELPAQMQNPTVSRVNSADDAILTYSVSSLRMDQADLSWFVDDVVAKRLLSIEGVGEVDRVGGIEREIRVEIEPDKLNAFGVTAGYISNQLEGAIGDRPSGKADIGGLEQSIRTVSGAGNRDEVANLRIFLPSGESVRVKDFARVLDTASEKREISLVDGVRKITFSVKRARGASELDTAESVRSAVQDLEGRYSHVEMVEIDNTTQLVESNYQAAMSTLYEGAILAIIAVWIFLRDWRATTVAAVALPLSIVPTFGIMYFSGFQLNSITLLSLTLIIGVLVDDAIVEIENIERHMKSGVPAKKASLHAANEIGLAVVATTLTLVAVFLPTAFMGGTAGMFFEQFGWTASIAVIFSLLVARLLTPMMAAYVMKPKPESSRPRNKVAVAIEERYLFVVRKSIKHPVVTVGLALGFVAISAAILLQLSTTFISAEDTNKILVKIETPPGSDIDKTLEVAEQGRAVLSRYPEVQRVYTTIGEEGSDRTATLLATLTPIEEVDRRSQQQIEAVLREDLKTIPGVRVSIGGNEAGQKFSITLKGSNSGSLDAAAQSVVRDIRSLQGVGNVNSSAGLERPELSIVPDYDKAAELGVDASALSHAVRLATTGDYEQVLPRLNLPNRQIYVRTHSSLEQRKDLDFIRNLKVTGNSGPVQLSSIADIQMTGAPAQIDRLDRSRNITITVDTLGRPLGDLSAEINSLRSLERLPSDVYRVTTGEAEQQKELFSGFAFAMIAGIICFYAVLVLLFHDFFQPLTILVALPLSAGGSFLALAIFGYSLSLSSLIGLIMLMGIVGKNSILLVDFAIMKKDKFSVSTEEAALDACRKRARPIIMTSFAMIAGMLPMALQLSVPSEFRSAMAVSVIGGLVTSTALSLVVVPAVYVGVENMKDRLRRVFAHVGGDPRSDYLET